MVFLQSSTGDAKATIATARQMGVKVKIVTGDALAIAQETAKMLTRISSWTDSVRRLFKVLKTRRQIGQPLWRRCDQRRLDRLIKAG